jgi:hypothetical protein
METYADKTLSSVLAPFLQSCGYKPAPRNYDFVFIKDRFVFIVNYDLRDDASIWFGVLNNAVDPIFGDFNTYSLRDSLSPYEHWLKLLSVNSAEFTSSCGGWVTGGLKTPDFAYLSSVVMDTLVAVEKLVLTNRSKHDVAKATRP